MRILPIHLWNDLVTSGEDKPRDRSTHPNLSKGIKKPRTELQEPQNRISYFLDRIASDSRVLIIEGISGSGKDTFQNYLKENLRDRGRDVYDYSEGELLQSWNQLQIEGIFKVRLKFMKLFVNHIKDILGRDENAIFLLNRFHLSAYVLTVARQPKLEREYDEIINVLRTLPVHVFILQLEENEIEKRSFHPERSRAWQKFQQQMVKREGFRDRLDRYVWQQKLMLEAAEKQQIPYSVMQLASETKSERVRARQARSILPRNVQINTADARISQRNRGLARTL